MPDTTPITPQQPAPAASSVVEAQTTPVIQPVAKPAETEQTPEGGVEEDGETEEVLRTEFMNLKDSLEMGMKQFKRMPHINPQSMRDFLIADLYPILMEIADYSNWYIGDLHRRVLNIEQEMEGEPENEALTPEFAEQLINFIGMSLQIFGVILQSPKVDPRLLQTAQLLTTQAPGLIAKVQEVTMTDEPDDDDNEYDEYEASEEESDEEDENVEPSEVLEPVKQGGERLVEAQSAPPVASVEPEPTIVPAAQGVAVPEAKRSSESSESSESSVLTVLTGSPDGVHPQDAQKREAAPEGPSDESSEITEHPPAGEEKEDG